MEPIGHGGRGRVYGALDIETGGDVALKVVEDESTDHEEELRRELFVLAALDHPAVVLPFELRRHEGLWGLAMEWVREVRLDVFPQAREKGRASKLSVLARLASMLAELHGVGVAHGDLEPANAIVVEGGQPRLFDFGFVRMGEHIGDAQGILAWIPGFMALEKLGGGPATPEADAFAFGRILGEAVYGGPAGERNGVRRAKRGPHAVFCSGPGL